MNQIHWKTFIRIVEGKCMTGIGLGLLDSESNWSYDEHQQIEFSFEFTDLLKVYKTTLVPKKKKD